MDLPAPPPCPPYLFPQLPPQRLDDHSRHVVIVVDTGVFLQRVGVPDLEAVADVVSAQLFGLPSRSKPSLGLPKEWKPRFVGLSRLNVEKVNNIIVGEQSHVIGLPCWGPDFCLLDCCLREL